MTPPISLATLFKASQAIHVKTRKISSSFVLEPTNWSINENAVDGIMSCTFSNPSHAWVDSDTIKINLKESMYSRDEIMESLQFFMDYTDSLYLDK